MSERLIFECGGTENPVALTEEFAPRTVAALRAWAPAEITLHCAKIAGSHIYWPTPVLETLERESDIHALPAGAFLYYPDRQYMEITYAALQAETASVSMLGMFEGDLHWFRQFAEEQRREQGRRVFRARLYFPDERERDAPREPTGAASALDRVRAERRAAWDAEPEELQQFMQRDGLNIPFGPLITAEGEFRRSQELLWRLWRNAAGHDDAARVQIAREVLDLAIARVVGYCQLTEAGAVLETGRDGLAEPGAPVGELLGELTIYCGRMAGWLDLQVPWWEANEITRRNRAAGRSGSAR